MENRMKNTFVLLVLVALAHSNRANEQTSSSNTNTTNVPPTTNPPTNAPPTSNPPITGSGNPNGSVTPIEIEVFYEALCEDSVNFVKNQLTLAYEKLNKFIHVTYIPFAQGKISKDGSNYTIECKRTGECKADQVHACGIKNITDQYKLLKFVNCSLVEGFKTKNIPIDTCGETSNLEKSTIESIKSCFNDNSSYPLLENYSKLSRENNVSFVPKIVVNKDGSEKIQTLSLNNLIQVICELIPKSDLPTECKNTDSGSSAVIVGMLPLLVSVYYFIRMF